MTPEYKKHYSYIATNLHILNSALRQNFDSMFQVSEQLHIAISLASDFRWHYVASLKITPGE
jgi:hypothetical protein